MSQILTQGGETFGVHCANTPHSKADTFNENYIDIATWKTSDSNDSSQVAVQNNRLEVTHSTGPQYNGLSTNVTYDLTGNSVYLRITDAGNQAIVSHEAQIQLYKDTSNAIWFTISNGNIAAFKLVASVQTQIGANVAYNTTNHAWVRIRESGGTTFFDTAPDIGMEPGTWTNQFSQANPITVTALTIYLKSGCWQVESSGSHAYFTNVTLPNVAQDLDVFITDSGNKNPGIFNFFLQWGSTGGYQNFIPGYMNSISSYGANPMITWEPWVGGGGATQSTYSLSNIIAGNFDAYIRQFATDASTWGKPFYLRFAHEMNGNWYPWSEQTNGNSAGQYATMWQHVYNTFTAICTNATWVWSVNTEFTGSTALSGLYPGDSYVNWAALDLYNWGTDSGHTWQTFTTVMSTTYTNILAATSTKPIMISEISCSENGGNKASWINSALTSEIFNYPKIETFIWFNNNNTPDWRIESSATAQEAFKQSLEYWLTEGKPVNAGKYLKVMNGMSRSEIAN